MPDGSVQTHAADLELGRIADRHAGRAHHGLADAEGEAPAARRHDARREVSLADPAPYPLLPQPAQGLDVLGRDVDDGQPASLLDVPVPDPAGEADRLHHDSQQPRWPTVKLSSG